MPRPTTLDKIKNEVTKRLPGESGFPKRLLPLLYVPESRGARSWAVAHLRRTTAVLTLAVLVLVACRSAPTPAATPTPVPVPMSLAEYAEFACRDLVEEWDGGFISSWEEAIEFHRWGRAEMLSIEPPAEMSEYHRLGIAFMEEYIRYIEEHASDSPYEKVQEVLAGMETDPAFQNGRRLLDEGDAISFSPETQAEIEAHGWTGDGCTADAS